MQDNMVGAPSKRLLMELPRISLLVSLTYFPLLLLNLSVAAPASSQAQPPFVCDTSDPSTKYFPFCKTSLPTNRRVSDLISRLTLDEKISQLVNTAPSIPRLGIPSYEWWSESLHGVSGTGLGIRFNGSIRAATSFPQVIVSAASFDAHLWYRIGQAVGVEARGVYNAGQAKGMTFWAPNINIFGDPRWGRGQETPGEDPLVTGKYAISYVRGLQGDSFHGGSAIGESLQASACCKHFTAYNLHNWKKINRFSFNARVTAQDLADTYQPPFQMCVEEGRASVVECSNKGVEPDPSCSDDPPHSMIIRGKWGFNGYITSDCNAIDIINTDEGYVKSPEDAVADVLKAGMDVSCGSYFRKHTKSAIEKKKVTVNDINRALTNLFSVRMRLGLLNGNPVHQRFGNIGLMQVCSKDHRELALDAARSGIVLLKNSGKLLPLSKTKTITVGVIGPNADTAETLQGNKYGSPCETITPLKALKTYIKDVRFHQGCDSVSCSSASIAEAVELAKSVDNVLLIVGLDQTQENEAQDREDLVLPGKQQSLILSVSKAARKPVILVILSGGPVDITFAKYNPRIGSILWVGYPGEAGGVALAEIIFGDHNPGGRLPVTWYPQDFTRVPMADMRLRPDRVSSYPGRTYRFYEGREVFRFGYGLSYSTYAYKFHSVNNTQLYLNHPHNLQSIQTKNKIRYLSVSEFGTENCEKIKFSSIVGVKNTGEMAGKHPVLLFIQQSIHRPGSPFKQLAGFQSLHLNAGESSAIEFVLSPCEHLARANEDGLMVLEEGSYFLSVGNDKSQLTVSF